MLFLCRCSDVTDFSLKFLPRSLTYLSLAGCKRIYGTGLKDLPVGLEGLNLKQLGCLRYICFASYLKGISETLISLDLSLLIIDNEPKEMVEFKKLEELVLERSIVKEHALSSLLKGCKSLKKLNVKGSNVCFFIIGVKWTTV